MAKPTNHFGRWITNNLDILENVHFKRCLKTNSTSFPPCRYVHITRHGTGHATSIRSSHLTSYGIRQSFSTVENMKDKKVTKRPMKDTSTQAIVKLIEKEKRRMNHFLESSPDKRLLDMLRDVILNRKFTVSKHNDGEIRLTKITNDNSVTIKYYTWSNESSLIDDSSEISPLEHFEVFVQSLKDLQSDSLSFRCMYNPQFQFVFVQAVPYKSSLSDARLYDGRDSEQMPKPLKVTIQPSTNLWL